MPAEQAPRLRRGCRWNFTLPHGNIRPHRKYPMEVHRVGWGGLDRNPRNLEPDSFLELPSSLTESLGSEQKCQQVYTWHCHRLIPAVCVKPEGEGRASTKSRRVDLEAEQVAPVLHRGGLENPHVSGSCLGLCSAPAAAHDRCASVRLSPHHLFLLAGRKYCIQMQSQSFHTWGHCH